MSHSPIHSYHVELAQASLIGAQLAPTGLVADFPTFLLPLQPVAKVVKAVNGAVKAVVAAVTPAAESDSDSSDSDDEVSVPHARFMRTRAHPLVSSPDPRRCPRCQGCRRCRL